MSPLEKRAYIQTAGLMAALGAAIFAAARSLEYWQGWVFLLLFFGPSVAIIRYLAINDPNLLQRRMRAGAAAEKETSQKIIQLLSMAAFIAIVVFPAIDYRRGWSCVPGYVVIAGDFLIALGFFVVFLVFKENSYASSIIEVGADQKIVTTGPYAIVRHPMYSGGLILLLGIPLALGSWWGLLTVIPITALIVWRLLEEEKFLRKNLSGYSEYIDRTKYRLLPSVW